MYTIDKTFEFCYGHRVWTQQLDGRYADDLKCACRHLHGHEAKVQVYLSAENLTNSMVTDFRHLEWLKKWLNEFVDHKFIIDEQDPLYDTLVGVPSGTMGMKQGERSITLARLPSLTTVEEGTPEYELLSGMLIVPFVPTSENLAKWLHTIVTFRMAPLGVKCTRVDWWETPKSRSSYISE